MLIFIWSLVPVIKISYCHTFNCFPRLYWHPPKQGRRRIYSSREHQYSCISILMPKGSFQHQHEHETCIRLDLNILEERKYFWSQTLCQCLVRSVTTGCSVQWLVHDENAGLWLDVSDKSLQIWSYPHIASPDGIRMWWTCSVCSVYSKSRDEA